MIRIREESPEDAAAIRALNVAAFPTPQEAGIVDALRPSCPERVSLVAAEGRRILGHILFTPVAIEAPGGAVSGMGLGPMAVEPDHQRQGIGSALVAAGLERLRRRACPFVVVLGHPGYYPRFGFQPAARLGIACPWAGVPDEAFLVLVLDRAIEPSLAGVARYRPEFDEAAGEDPGGSSESKISSIR